MKGFNHLISSFVMGHFTHIAEITCPYGIMPLNIYLFLDYFSILRIIFQNDLNTIGEPFMDQGKTKSLPCSIHVILKYTPENCKIIWKQIPISENLKVIWEITHAIWYYPPLGMEGMLTGSTKPHHVHIGSLLAQLFLNHVFNGIVPLT